MIHSIAPQFHWSIDPTMEEPEIDRAVDLFDPTKRSVSKKMTQLPSSYNPAPPMFLRTMDFYAPKYAQRKSWVMMLSTPCTTWKGLEQSNSKSSWKSGLSTEARQLRSLRRKTKLATFSTPSTKVMSKINVKVVVLKEDCALFSALT